MYRSLVLVAALLASAFGHVIASEVEHLDSPDRIPGHFVVTLDVPAITLYERRETVEALAEELLQLAAGGEVTSISRSPPPRVSLRQVSDAGARAISEHPRVVRVAAVLSSELHRFATHEQ